MSENAGNENTVDGHEDVREAEPDQEKAVDTSLEDRSPEVERTTETTTVSGNVPDHEDKREELRTPEPEVTQETVTETVSESQDGDGDDAA